MFRSMIKWIFTNKESSGMYIVQNICFISHAEQKRKEKKLADSTAKLTILKEIISNYITVVGSYEIKWETQIPFNKHRN